MSLSINRHLITTSYDQSNMVKSNENGLNTAGHTTHKKSNDSLELSKEFMEYTGGMQIPFAWNIQEASNQEDNSTTSEKELTVDEKRSLLSDLQSVLSSSLISGSTASDKDQETDLLSALKDAWGNTDESNAIA